MNKTKDALWVRHWAIYSTNLWLVHTDIESFCFSLCGSHWIICIL